MFSELTKNKKDIFLGKYIRRLWINSVFQRQNTFFFLRNFNKAYLRDSRFTTKLNLHGMFHNAISLQDQRKNNRDVPPSSCFLTKDNSLLLNNIPDGQ